MTKVLPKFTLNQSKSAEFLGVTRKKMRELLDSGKIKGEHKPGAYRGSWSIDIRELSKWLEV